MAGALVECRAGICRAITLVCAAVTGLFRALPVGQVARDWYLAMAIISTLMLLALGYICHCATCYVSMLEAEEYEALVHHFTGKRQPSRRSSERPEGGSVIIS